MTPTRGPHALYYPFHLCHPETLHRLLARFATIHFRDFMALQLTPMAGITAYQNRMGAEFPQLVANGRLVQGYDVSGPLPPDIGTAVDLLLADPSWRGLFHQALCRERRFQRGLFDLSHAVLVGGATVPGASMLLYLMDQSFLRHPFSIEEIKKLSSSSLTVSEGYSFEYGLALVKTSASLVYTSRLAQSHHLTPVTDSPAHFALFEQCMRREGLVTAHHLVIRQGY